MIILLTIVVIAAWLMIASLVVADNDNKRRLKVLEYEDGRLKTVLFGEDGYIRVRAVSDDGLFNRTKKEISELTDSQNKISTILEAHDARLAEIDKDREITTKALLQTVDAITGVKEYATQLAEDHEYLQMTVHELLDIEYDGEENEYSKILRTIIETQTIILKNEKEYSDLVLNLFGVTTPSEGVFESTLVSSIEKLEYLFKNLDKTLKECQTDVIALNGKVFPKEPEKIAVKRVPKKKVQK